MKQRIGFTLVELVITITILVILSTIAFVSFQSYTQDSRDANRLASVGEIQNGLNLSYSKNGSYPTPKNATTYTGTSLSVLQGTLTQEVLPELQSDPKDPLSKSSYVYSTTSDGNYFQIASDIENSDIISQLSPQKTYAKVTSALVKGNYKFDPVLPSLILIPTNSLTNSGVFALDNCFVVNGGVNTLGNTTCTSKKNMVSAQTDSNLVGYWDMETLTGTNIWDMSGNGNDLLFSGGMVYASAQTGGVIGKALSFNGSAEHLFASTTKNLDIEYTKDFTIQMVVKIPPIQNDTSNEYKYVTLLEKGLMGSKYPYTITLGTQSYASPGSIGGSTWDGTNNPTARINDNNANSTYFLLTFVRENRVLKMYKNSVPMAKTPDTTTGTTLAAGSPFLVGGGYFSATRFTGVIDELKIYTRALSDGEVEQNAQILGF